VQVLPAKKRKARRSELQIRNRWVNDCQDRANTWLKLTPSFVLPNVKLEQLEMQPCNRPEDVALAKETMKAMESQEADTCSGRWYDQSGRLMVAVFTDHISLVPVSSAHDLLSPDLTDRRATELQ
jgi:hypothetical protein